MRVHFDKAELRPSEKAGVMVKIWMTNDDGKARDFLIFPSRVVKWSGMAKDATVALYGDPTWGQSLASAGELMIALEAVGILAALEGRGIL